MAARVKAVAAPAAVVGPGSRDLAPAGTVPPSLTVPVVDVASVLDVGATAVVGVLARPGDAGPLVPEVAGLPGLAQLAAREGATGAAGQKHALTAPLGVGGVRSVAVAGLGAEPTANDLRAAGAFFARTAAGIGNLAILLGDDLGAEHVRALVEGVVLASYGYSLAKKIKPQHLHTVTLVGTVDEAAAAAGAVTAAAVLHARDLVNTPSLAKSPEWLADRAVEMAHASGLTVEVLDAPQLTAAGYGGIAGVGQGSSRPPRRIKLEYTPAGATRKTPHVVLVGKGITFDSGGLSIKSAPGMEQMKTDMGGAAAVICAMAALTALKVGVRVTGLVAAAENMPSGTAIRPGDVLTHLDGQTTEVLNTDAEGRLVLADVLVEASRMKPRAIVDLATLTGAMANALSKTMAGYFSSDEDLAVELEAAGAAAGEQLWRFPLVDDYEAGLASPVADRRNIGDPALGFGGGAITAALFLRGFTGDVPWAHIDIAGPSGSAKDAGVLSKGGTGYGTATLIRWLESL